VSPPLGHPIRDAWDLDPDFLTVNHGSFGATPRIVRAAQRAWQDRMERQPTRFMTSDLPAALRQAAGMLGLFLNAAGQDLAFVDNATTGCNAMLRSLALRPGDEVLILSHAYGAVRNAVRFAADRAGARVTEAAMPFPQPTEDALVAAVTAAITPRIRLAVIDHITSGSAVVLPAARIVRACHEAGVPVLIDGAHAPGQVDVDLTAIAADWYTGNCHKWLCAPKGSGFLFARPEHQDSLDPLIISWGYEADVPGPSRFLDHLERTGTQDPAAYLSVPAAIAFQRAHDWPRVRAACHLLARDARERIAALTGLPQIAPDSAAWWVQMCTCPLPPIDGARLKERLWDDYQVEIPVSARNGRASVRVSIQAYNRPEDVDRLLKALTALLP
jgi:isopenicillin-N epimerase